MTHHVPIFSNLELHLVCWYCCPNLSQLSLDIFFCEMYPFCDDAMAVQISHFFQIVYNQFFSVPFFHVACL